MNFVTQPEAIKAAITRARRYSPFLSLCLSRETDLAARLEAGELPAFADAAAVDAATVAQALRIERRRLALIVAIGDLAGALDLTQVTAALTDFADRALDIAIRTAITEIVPGAEPVGFTAIALGKQGSHELNYSSDIDPILLFDPAILPHRARDEPQESAVRIGKRVVELLQARDGDGYVLRIDLRLRPSPEATPIVLPMEAALHYYESQALAWERAAFIRARAAAGDMALGQRFLDQLKPFVWRRSLDFGAIREIRDISRRIRDHHAQGQAFGPGYDLKRGRGGIREVEFFAQIHQLIHGGRDPALRAPATRDALAALAAAGRIDAGEAEELAAAYTLYRTIEHRVQMVDDRQTHSLPQGEALEGLARLHGLDDSAALLAGLAPHVERVGRIYDSIEPAGEAQLSPDPVLLGDRLESAGFSDPADVARRIEIWRGGSYPALRSPAARAALESMLPGLITAFGEASDPQGALIRLDAMLAKLPTAVNFLRLLEAQPVLARLTAAILSHAPTLAEALARRPDLLDGLIDASALGLVGTVEELAAEMRDEPDYQALLDHVRKLVGEKRFALGVQIVAGVSDPLSVAYGYARVAEAAICVLTQATVDEFARAHGVVPGSELLILALGRMGGGALTHASDLDLVYLFTGDYQAESDGAKPLGAVHYYNRLAQRISAALSVPTASGPLYEIDTRLRPSGAQGPLVVSLDGFERYQRESAWTWEHMALTRARPIFGSPEAREEVMRIVHAVLAGDRPDRDVAQEAGAMRAEMATHKPPQGPLDAKLLPGGLVDLEFATHVAQLTRHTAFLPNLGEAIDALILQDIAPATMRPAHDLLTRLLVTLRLVAPDCQPPPTATRALIARALTMPDWETLVAKVAETRQEVRLFWNAERGE